MRVAQKGVRDHRQSVVDRARGGRRPWACRPRVRRRTRTVCAWSRTEAVRTTGITPCWHAVSHVLSPFGNLEWLCAGHWNYPRAARLRAGRAAGQAGRRGVPAQKIWLPGAGDTAETVSWNAGLETEGGADVRDHHGQSVTWAAFGGTSLRLQARHRFRRSTDMTRTCPWPTRWSASAPTASRAGDHAGALLRAEVCWPWDANPRVVFRAMTMTGSRADRGRRLQHVVPANGQPEGVTMMRRGEQR